MEDKSVDVESVKMFHDALKRMASMNLLELLNIMPNIDSHAIGVIVENAPPKKSKPDTEMKSNKVSEDPAYNHITLYHDYIVPSHKEIMKMPTFTFELLRDSPMTVASSFVKKFESATNVTDLKAVAIKFSSELEKYDTAINNLQVMLHWAIVTRAGKIIEWAEMRQRQGRKETIESACRYLYDNSREGTDMKEIIRQVQSWATTFKLWRKYPKLCLTKVPSATCWIRQAGNIMELLDGEPKKAKKWLLAKFEAPPRLPLFMKMVAETEEDARKRAEKKHEAARAAKRPRHGNDDDNNNSNGHPASPSEIIPDMNGLNVNSQSMDTVDSQSMDIGDDDGDNVGSA